MTIPLRLLVAASAGDIARVKRHLMEADYAPETRKIADPDALSEALQAGQWDVVVADSLAPGGGATAYLDALKESAQDLPFIVLYDSIRCPEAVALLKSGANDVVRKTRIPVLPVVIGREITLAKERAEAEHVEAALHQRIVELELIVAMTRILHARGPVEKRLTRAVDMLRRAALADGVTLRVPDSSQGGMVLLPVGRRSSTWPLRVMPFDSDELAPRAYRTKRPAVSANWPQDFPESASRLGVKYDCMAVFPFSHQDEVFATLGIAWTDASSFSDRVIAMVEGIIAQVSPYMHEALTSLRK